MVCLTYRVSSFSENHPQWVTSLCVFIFFISFIFWLLVFLFCLCEAAGGVDRSCPLTVHIDITIRGQLSIAPPSRACTVKMQLMVLTVECGSTDRQTDQHCSIAKTAQSCGNTAAKCKKVCRDKKSSLRATSGNIFAS